MNNKNLILGLLVVVLIIAGVFFVLGRYTPKGLPPGQLVQPVSSPLETVQAIFALEPEQTTIAVGEEAVYRVMVSTSDAVIVGTEAYLTYDPTVVSVEKVVPGSLFSQSEILNNTIDEKKGIIWFAVGSRHATQSSGEAIRITVKGLKEHPEGTNLMSIDQSKSKVGLAKLENNKYDSYNERETAILFDEKSLTITP